MTDEPRPDEPGSTVAESPPATDTTAESGNEAENKLKQTVEIRDAGPCKKYIKVTLDRTSIDQRLNSKFSELVNDANVAGFRPGKAPRKVIERRYHKEVADQVKAEILLASLEQLAEEHDIAPLAAPNIDPFKIELPREGPLVYEFEVEVRPEFDLPNYKGLKLRRPVRNFTDEDVFQEKRRLLAPYGAVVPKTDGAAEVGDILVADVTSRDGGRVLTNLKDFKVRIDRQLAFKDGVAKHFADQVKGVKPGDSRTVDITLSTSTSDETLRGKTIQATFDVKEVQTLQLPELTHEFLHRFGVHSEEQFDELVRVLLQRRLEYSQRQAARQQVLAQITAASQWDLPRDLLIRQARRAFSRRIMDMQAQGISEDEIKSRQRLLEQDVLENTALALKEHFVLQKIAEIEKIDVEEEDLDAEIDRIAEQNNESPRRLRARIEKDDLMEALAAELIERRALDLVLDSAEYEDVVVGQEDQSAADTSTVEEQAVPGEMQDLTTPPPESEESKTSAQGE